MTWIDWAILLLLAGAAIDQPGAGLRPVEDHRGGKPGSLVQGRAVLGQVRDMEPGRVEDKAVLLGRDLHGQFARGEQHQAFA